MEKVNEILQAFLEPGPAVFVPIIILIFALAVGVKFQNAIKSALMIGIAFVATGLVIGALVAWVQPAFENLGSNLGFDTVDVGWIPLATLAWSWPYAFIIFPIQILINVIMIWRNWTKTLNIDLWNIWHKPFIAMLVIGVVGGGWIGIVLGFLVAIIQIILELKNADLVKPAVYKVTKINEVTVPHAVGLFAPIIYPVDTVLNKIKFFQDGKSVIKKKSSKKFGIFLENDIIGFLLGMLIGFIGWDSDMWYRPFLLGVQVAAALSLLPIAAKFFVKSLNPITTRLQTVVQKKYQDRKLYVGLDFPVLAGSQNLWIAMGIWAPITLAYAFLFQFTGTGIFPLAMIINTSLGIPALLITGGNLRKMIVMGIIYTPIFLLVGTWGGEIITQGLIDQNVLSKDMQDYIDAGKKISSAGIEMPTIRFILPNVMGLFTGKVTTETITGISLLPILIGLWVFYYLGMKKRIANGYYDLETSNSNANTLLKKAEQVISQKSQAKKVINR